jgi:hypothetical protein
MSAATYRFEGGGIKREYGARAKRQDALTRSKDSSRGPGSRALFRLLANCE